MFSAPKEALGGAPHALQIVRRSMSVGVAWRAKCEDYAPSCDEDKASLWSRWSDGAVESGEDTVVCVGRLNHLSSPMGAAKYALLIGIMELRFLESLPSESKLVVLVL